MLSFVVVLLTATPGHASLLSPVEPELLHSLRLVAQASPEAPPPPLVSAPDARIRELTARIDEINERLNTMELGWPRSARRMLIAGYVLTPMLLLGIPLAAVGDRDDNAGLQALGGLLIAATPVGVTLLIIALINGRNGELRSRIERNALVEELSEAEDELRALKSRQNSATHRWGPSLPRHTVAAVSFSF